jgi:transposase
MSKRELRRVEVLSRVASKELKLVDAAVLMQLSYRQAKRIWQRYQREGAEGLKHRSAGGDSSRAKPKEFREQVLTLVREKYSGTLKERFGPTLASEHLESEDGVQVHPETLRRWMLSAGLWSRARKGRKHRRWREPKAHFGELVQMDGSFHDWFEGRGPTGCLMNLVDDATAETLGRLGGQETIWAAAGVLRCWIESYGVPLALYVDWKNVYVQEPTEGQLRRGESGVTQFGRMCERLGIGIIAANSPQAKGRVERNHGTHQDRLVKKLRLKNIQDYSAANEYLESEYLLEHNQRYARPAASEKNYHRSAPSRKELDEVFHLEASRVIGNDWVVRYQNRFLQVKRQARNYAPAKGKVVVCEWEDGRLEVRHRGKKVKWEEIPGRPAVAAPKAKPRTAQHQPSPPKSDHPWKQPYQQMRPRRSAQAPVEDADLVRAAASATP